MTFTAGSVLTAAQLNQQLRDNLLETAPAKATAAAQIFVSTGANAIAARTPAQNYVAGGASTTSAAYTDLGGSPGPALTVTTGTKAFVILSAHFEATANQTAYMSYAVSGASTLSPADGNSAHHRPTAANGNIRASSVWFEETLTAGSNTFTAKYRVETGGSTAQFNYRSLAVIPF
jgi:hypothetical protein